MEKELKMVSYQEKMDFLVHEVQQNPNISLSQYPGYFEDGSSKARFWNYSSVIVKRCSEKEKLNEKELYIIMSHAIIDDLKGKHSSMSRKEKIDYIYNLILQDPSIVISKCKLSFPDGTQVIGFWNMIQTEIRNNREKNLTEEENYIYYTSACIDELKRQESLRTLIFKLEEFYKFISEDETHSVYNKKMKFPDGTYYAHFWNWLQIQIQKCHDKKELSQEELITLYYGAKLDEILAIRKKKFLSVLDKAYYLLEYIKSHPLENLLYSQEVFSDGTSLYAFHCNLYRFYNSKQNKTHLSKKEQEIMNIYLEMRKIRKQAKLEAQKARVRKLIQ